MELQRDVDRLKVRQQSQLIKQEGDNRFAEGDLDGAMGLYKEALDLDGNNEYAFANIGLIHMKRGDYPKCIEFSSKALELVEAFMCDSRAGK